MEKRKGKRYEDPSGVTDRRRTWRFPLFWLFKAGAAAAMRWKHAAVFHAGVFVIRAFLHVRNPISADDLWKSGKGRGMKTPPA